jgi:hypothetical protein
MGQSNYRVVWSTSLESLTSEVNRYLSMNYIALGNVFISEQMNVGFIKRLFYLLKNMTLKIKLFSFIKKNENSFCHLCIV